MISIFVLGKFLRKQIDGLQILENVDSATVG